MKIFVVDATGKTVLGGGIARENKRVELEVPELSIIAKVWQEGKRAIGKVPFKEPIINRQEVADPNNPGKTLIVSGSYRLKEGEVLYLVFC